VSLIGKEVLARGNTVQAAGSPVALSYQLAGDAAEGMVRIYNAAGEFVDALSFRNQKQGLNTLTWSPPSSLSGACTYEVIATDRAGRAVGADTLVQGEVTGVNYRDGAVTLSVGGREIAYGDVVSVKKINTN